MNENDDITRIVLPDGADGVEISVEDDLTTVRINLHDEPTFLDKIKSLAQREYSIIERLGYGVGLTILALSLAHGPIDGYQFLSHIGSQKQYQSQLLDY